MSDIFISYASEDRDTARQLAKALETHGWSVWWDRTIPAGRTFVEVIDEAMTEARCVVVAWSATSVNKNWVLEEAQDGLDRGILVPVFIEQVTPPRGFRRIQAADLSEWDGSVDAPAFRHFVNDLTGILGPPPHAAAAETSQMPREPIGDERKEARQPPRTEDEKPAAEDRGARSEAPIAKPEEPGMRTKPPGKARRGRGMRLFFFVIVVIAAALAVLVAVERSKPVRVVPGTTGTTGVPRVREPAPPPPRPPATGGDATTPESRALLGIRFRDVTQEVAASMGLDKPRGAMVQDVTPNSAASRAGLRVGDVVLEFNRQAINGPSDLARLVRASRPGATVVLLIRRDKQSLFVTATLTAAEK